MLKLWPAAAADISSSLSPCSLQSYSQYLVRLCSIPAISRQMLLQLSDHNGYFLLLCCYTSYQPPSSPTTQACFGFSALSHGSFIAPTRMGKVIAAPIIAPFLLQPNIFHHSQSVLGSNGIHVPPLKM